MTTTPGKPKAQKTKANVSFPPDVFAIIERLAMNEGRPVANMIRVLTMEALTARGKLDSKDEEGI